MNNSDLLKIVNASGFLYQLRVEDEINRTRSKRSRSWDVVAREHRWIDPITKNEGFIDLVIEDGIGKMVIECKRVTDSNWIFLVPEGSPETYRTKVLWTHTKGIRQISDWDDLKIYPPTLESNFCTIRGQGEKDTPMLERISSTLLRSVEALADQELALTNESDISTTRLYYPVIITNATLHVCKFDSRDVDLDLGKLHTAEFENVRSIRFRKNLSSTYSKSEKTQKLFDVNRKNERTLLVMNTGDIGITLRDWKVEYTGSWPWPVG